MSPSNQAGGIGGFQAKSCSTQLLAFILSLYQVKNQISVPNTPLHIREDDS